MIKLNICIGEGDCAEIPFANTSDLLEYIEELKRIDCIWVIGQDEEPSELLITENVNTIIKSIEMDFWDINLVKDSNIFIQQYESYEAAYDVALDLKEPNPRCYNK
jgi:hypothetical protein